VAAVEQSATTVRAWDGKPTTTNGPVADLKLPLAGFGIIEATDLNEVIELVANTPCARAKGAVEIRAITAMNKWQTTR
jgi:hypothetical protein